MIISFLSSIITVLIVVMCFTAYWLLHFVVNPLAAKPRLTLLIVGTIGIAAFGLGLWWLLVMESPYELT